MNVEWGEYRLGDLFDVDSWVYGKNKNWKSRVNQQSSRGLPVISGITANNGVNYYTYDKAEPFEIFENCLTISTRGEYSGTVTYHDGKFVLANNILVMLTPNYSKNQKKFIGALINSLSYGGYSGYPRKETLKDDIIQLPTKNGTIDFEFMESFVAELEAQRVAELEAYLIASGLDDYELSLDEINLLNQFDEIEWSLFNLKDLFGNATRGKRLKSADRIAGQLPFVTAGETDEGVSAYIGNKVAIFNENTITIDMFGSAKYRNYKYGADDHVAVVHTENIPKLASIFITAAIHKAAYTGKFNYGNNFYAKDADALNVILPIKNGLPDYNYMELVISYVQKLVIKDVVDYTNNKIEKTKQVINYK